MLWLPLLAGGGELSLPAYRPIPVYSYHMSHPFGEQGPDTFVSIGRVEEWNDQQVREVKVHKKPMSVVRLGERFFALNSICPHMGGPMSCGPVSDGKLHCPWHDWAFDIETGKSPNGHCLTRYQVKVEEGEVKVGWVITQA